MKTIFFLLLALLICSEGGEIQEDENKPDNTPEENEEVRTAKMTKEEFRMKNNITKEQIASWDAYLKVYRKYYSDLKAGNINRSKIFEDTLNHINKWNREYELGLHDYKKGVNIFTAMSEQETAGLRMKIHLHPNQNVSLKVHQQTVSGVVPFSENSYPTRVDWRERGIISEVKYQAACAACYAFSVTDTLEAQYSKKFRRNLLLSAQMLVDCTDGVNYGCAGGYMDRTFEFIKERGGIPEERMYPFERKAGRCRIMQHGQFYSLKDYVTLPPGDEFRLMQIVASVGPVAVGIDASPKSFLEYSSGIYDDPECKKDDLDHTAVVVGYGTESGKDYWIIKNSWSRHWGEEGYMRIRRNKGNVCGIASSALYPLI